MKQKKVFLLSGLPASGKSTYVRNNLSPQTDVWVSRDAIRFNMVAEDESYFSRETAVVREFYRQAQEAIDNENIENVYVDATHLGPHSWNATLNNLNINEECSLICLWFSTPIEECIKRNNGREGRTCVPEGTIQDMALRRSYPRWGFDEVWTIDQEGRVTHKKKTERTYMFKGR